MKKRMKFMGMLLAVGLLAVTGATASYTDAEAATATGWQQENGVWVYIDRDGDRVTNAWRKSGNQYYYLNEDGIMLTNTLIEYGGDKYYLGENGAKVRGVWKTFPNNGECDQNVSNIHYYFSFTGKAYTSIRKTIDGKIYIFDDEGHMLSGWQTYGDNEDLYYLGTEDEGGAYLGWQYLEPKEDNDDIYDDEEWFYFHPGTGKAYRNSKKFINGNYYTFDENGIMLDKWVTGTPGAPLIRTSSNAIATDSSAKYKEDIGFLQKEWVYAYAPDDPDGDGNQNWYYLDPRGVPFNYMGKDANKVDGELFGWAIQKDGDKWLENDVDIKTGAAAKKIKGKTYLFDSEGRMLTGVYRLIDVRCVGRNVNLGRTEAVMDGEEALPGAVYYFNKNEGAREGMMMTGRQAVDYDGDKYYYHFKSDGSAYTNAIVNGTLYGWDGTRISAEEGDRYRLYELEPGQIIRENGRGEAHEDCTMLINEAGKVTKRGTIKIDGYRYKIENYEVVEVEEIN